MNPCVAGPARYMYVMAQDKCFPSVFGKIHPQYKSPYISVLVVGAVAMLLILTDSIPIIAAMCAFSQMVCYIIGFISYLGLYKKEPELKRPYQVPAGKLGAVISIIAYLILMVLAVDWSALPYNIGLSVLCILYYLLAVRQKHNAYQESVEDDFSSMPDMIPTVEEKNELDRQYKKWRIGSYSVFCFGMLLFVIGYIYR